MIERWVPVSGYEGCYEVSDHGKVRGLDRDVAQLRGFTKSIKGRVLRGFIDKNGYHCVSLAIFGKKSPKKVHRLVAIHFVPNSGLLTEVNHKDLDKENNHFSNLEFTTHSENMRHATEAGVLGRRRKAIRGGTIVAIRQAYEDGESPRVLSKRFGVSAGYTRQIVLGRTRVSARGFCR